MSDETTRDGQTADRRKSAPLPANGPSTNREQVPGGLEGSIMEPATEKADSDNAGRRPAGSERRSDEL